MVIHKGRKVRLGECWFEKEKTTEPLDVLSCRQMAVKPLRGYAKSFLTPLFDLTLEEDTLSKLIRKSTFSKIRRARDRDGVVTRTIKAPETNDLDRFVDFFNGFARSKGLGEITRNFLEPFAEAGQLQFRLAVNEESEEELVWHSYLVNADRARLFHSASGFRNSEDSGYRNMIGRVNRFLHWDDMLAFKEQGLTVYDMGGWYPGEEDRAKVAIRNFKDEFGGTVTEEYDVLIPQSFKGLLYVMRARIKG